MSETIPHHSSFIDEGADIVLCSKAGTSPSMLFDVRADTVRALAVFREMLNIGACKASRMDEASLGVKTEGVESFKDPIRLEESSETIVFLLTSIDPTKEISWPGWKSVIPHPAGGGQVRMLARSGTTSDLAAL